MRKLFLSITYILLFLFCTNNLFGQKIDSIHKRLFILNSYIQTYQTVQLIKENGFSNNVGFKFFNSYFGLMLSFNIYNTGGGHKPFFFPSSLRSFEIVSGYLVNPQTYGGSISDQSVLPGYKFKFGCVPFLFKLNFFTQRQNKYYISFGLDGYFPIFKKEINDYNNLNHFDYKSQENLGSFHFEIGCTKSISKKFNINIGGISQIFPRVHVMASHGISEITSAPFSIFVGSSINLSFNLFNFKY